MCETLYHAAATVPGRLALVDCVADAAARRQWTYAEFVAAAEQAARALLARFEPGERIAIWAPNSAEWVILQQGISLAGMVLVALNPAYRTREMQFVLEQSGAAGLFCADAYRGFDMLGMAEAIRPSLPGLREIVSLATWDEFLASADPGQVLPQVAPGDMIQVQYTSGTTGFPRGAMLHHMGLVNEATFVAERAGMGDGGVCVNAMPMYHIGGGAVTSFGIWAKRGTFVILPGFEPGLLLEAFEAYSGTHTLVVPTMLIAMLDHPDLAQRDLSSLQTIMSGAASVQNGAGQVHRWQCLPEQDGCDVAHRGPVQQFWPVGRRHGTDQDVDGAERAVGLGDGRLHLVGVARVGRDEYHLRARTARGDRLPGRRAALGVPCQQGQPPHPGVDEAEGAGQAHSGGAPGDDDGRFRIVPDQGSGHGHLRWTRGRIQRLL